MFTLVNLLKSKIGWLEASGPSSEVVVCSRIRLARNLEPFLFPHVASNKELGQVWQKTVEAARHLKSWQSAAFVKLSEIDHVDLHFLVERHLISMDLAEKPQQRGVVIAGKETVSLMINEEDHLRLQVMQPGLSLGAALEQAMALEADLGKTIPFAWRPDFGYLTSCPTNVGTGLRASCLVHLPALTVTQNIAPLLQELTRSGLAVRGFYGEGSKTYGDLFQISNAVSLGSTEQDFTRQIESAIKKLMRHELQMREKLFISHKNEVLDQLWRSYGVLSHARAISFEEAMQELSKIRFGVASGLKMGALDLTKMNELMIITQPAHIQMQAQKDLKAHERDEWRASMVRKILG